jgi:hypothetical protein
MRFRDRGFDKPKTKEAAEGQDKDRHSGDRSASLEAYREKAASDRTVLRND